MRRTPSVHDLAAFGAYLRTSTTASKRFAAFHGVTLPDDANWREALLRLFTRPAEPPLPELIPPELAAQLTAYRGFRHMFTKRYAVHLEWAKLEPLIDGVRSVHEAFQRQVEAALPPQAPPPS